MCFRKLILLFLFVFVCDKLLAATFMVTSNGDSGTGTLRQALFDAAANGTSTTDYIYFNLPGATPAAMTITLLSQLPDVTANVIIDGTTQLGFAFGQSNAKVIITPATPAANFNCFNVSGLVGVNDAVEIYGLYIKGFSPNQSGLGSAIVTNANCKLVVGAPGKGNVISGNDYAFNGHFQNAIIQSNFIGVQPDGTTVFANASVFYSGLDYNNLLMGGPVQQDGNVILCGPTSGLNFGGVNDNTNKIATIQNNYFNTDYRGTTPIGIANNQCILLNDAKSLLFVTANVFSATEIAISGVNQSAFVIKGNFFGVDKTQTFSLASGSYAIECSGANSSIGGTTAADQNVFTNYQNPIDAYNGSFTNVIQNSFYCNATVQLYDPSGGQNFIRITTLTNNTVGGDAPAGATVQLYYTDQKCVACNPKTSFATVTANGTGKWTYNGPVTQNVVASSTLFNNTVGFQFDSLAQDEVTITNFDCHHAGSIVLKEKRLNKFILAWHDSNGNSLGGAQGIYGLQPGAYTLQISETGNCPSVTGSFTIIDLRPHAFSQTVQLDCNTTSGTFTAFPSTGPNITVAQYNWEDSNGVVFSHSQTVSGLAPGKYYIYITDSNGCNSNKALCQVLAPVGVPVVDDSQALVTNAQCAASNGSVTGIKVSNGGNANYYWTRPDGSQLAYGQTALTNVPAGTYYFNAFYDFSCPPLQSGPYTVSSVNSVIIDASGAIPTSSTCSNSNGSIKGVVVTDATQYQWFDSGNNVVGTSVDLTAVSSGSYYLVASNASCSSQTPPITVNNIPAVVNFPSTVVTTDAACGLNNGSVVITFQTPGGPASYRWTTASGTPVISNAALTNAAPGDYNLYVTDDNGCESLYNTYTINATPILQIVGGSAQITNDQCAQNLGSISNISVTDGLPPYTYNWVNSQGQSVGASQNLSGVGAGVYTLQVTDATACGLVSQDYTVTSDNMTVPTPTADNVQICTPGVAMIMVNNPQLGYGYHLYDTNTSTTVLDDETSGVFKVSVSATRSYYISQYVGGCESQRVEVNIELGLSSVTVPSAFTPNNDGINDLWILPGIENYPTATVQIFNRYGQKLFESKGYSQPFDGRVGGSLLPAGVYYYIISLNNTCRLLSGSLTIIR